LIELHEGAIKGFSLILQPHQDFYLDFSHSDDDLIYCRLPTEEELNQPTSIYTDQNLKGALLV
jgi:hypothetical protein